MNFALKKLKNKLKFAFLLGAFLFVACSLSDKNSQNLALNSGLNSKQNLKNLKTAAQVLNENNDNSNALDLSVHYARLDMEQNISKLPKFNGFDVDLKALKKEYLAKFFEPWHKDFKRVKLDKNALFWSFKNYLDIDKNYYFFSKILISKEFFQKAFENANTNALLSVNKKALVVRNTALKNAPLQTEILLNPFKDGEGVPFDYALDSALNAGTPVLISHFSKDKAFAFVNSALGWGFVDARDIEIFTPARAKIYESLEFITPLKEKEPVLSVKNEFLFNARVGAVYPIYKQDKEFYYGKIGAKSYKIAKNKAAPFPLTDTNMNLKRAINELLNLPYGWGGYGFERDCSLLMRDIFGVFGIFLPRNSYAQALSFKSLDLSNLDNEAKMTFIKKHAKPYKSMLYLKGHIVLYVGEIDGQMAIFHSIWGLKSLNDTRLLIAKSALTPIDIGSSEEKVAKQDLILSRMSLLINVLEK